MRSRKAFLFTLRTYWEQAKVCSAGCPSLHQPYMCWSKATVPPAGHRPCCSLWTICSHRLFDYRGRLSPVPVPRAVPVKRPRVTVPLVRRVKTTIPVKLFARSTAITTGTAKIKCECLYLLLDNFHFVISKIIESHFFTLENR